MKRESQLDILEFSGPGYQPCVDHGTWRVALLRYSAEVEASKITYLECHQETDEVFVLLAGRCTLLLGEGDGMIESVRAVEMAPHMLYNIKKMTYHNHALSKDALVLIVENQNTGEENSARIPLSPEQQKQILSLTADSWNDSR